MKKYLFLIMLAISTGANAESTSNDFGVHSGEVKSLTNKELRERFGVSGFVYVLSPDGKRLLSQGHEARGWSFGSKGDLVSNWSFSSDTIEKFALKHHWKIEDNGEISVHIQQYDEFVPIKGAKEPKYGKLIREEKLVLQNFSSIIWEVHKNNKQKVIIKLDPHLKENEALTQIGKLPIAGKDIVAIDNKSQVWLQDASFSAEYVAITTAKGSFYLSYLPFKGSNEIGFAKGTRLQLKVSDSHTLSLASSTAFLPQGLKAKVYGKVDLSKKSSSPNSVHISASDQEKEFLEVFEKVK